MQSRAVPKAFGFCAQKGIFPFLFACPENYSYSGPIHAEEFFMPASMKEEEYTAFKQ